jgi:hypothetical protein
VVFKKECFLGEALGVESGLMTHDDCVSGSGF